MEVNGYTIKPNADLHGANLRDTNLRDADLTGSDLTGSDLTGTDLRYADLTGTDLRYADLTDVNLRWANLTGVNLSDVDLRYVNLSDVDLRYVNLTGANLRGANLTGANLSDVDLTDAILPAFQIPQEGSLIVWKHIILKPTKGTRKHIYGLAKLKIPKGSRRTASLVGRKCRAEYTMVLSLHDLEGVKVTNTTGISLHSASFEYYVDKIVYPNSYNDDVKIECTQGIHFFLTMEEAKSY